VSRGDELWGWRCEILRRLYEEGAFWSRSSVEMVWLKYTLSVDISMTEYKPFIDWLKEEGLIKEGPKSKLYLSSDGIKEVEELTRAARLSGEPRGEGTRGPKRRMGFREPGEEQGEGEA